MSNPEPRRALTAEQRRELLGDDVIALSRHLAETTTVWPPRLVADLAVLLRKTPPADTSSFVKTTGRSVA